MLVYTSIPCGSPEYLRLGAEGGKKTCSAVFRELKQHVYHSQQRSVFRRGGKALAAKLRALRRLLQKRC